MTRGSIDISALRNEVISSRYKGLPIASHGKTVAEFLNSKPTLFGSDFQFPIGVIRESALRHNISRMEQYCKEAGVVHSPHVKTTMSPEIAKMQMEAGSWSVTLANYFQANVFLDFGFSRVIIANEVLEPTAIRAIAERNNRPGNQIVFYVDSLAGLGKIQAAISEMENPKLHLLIEIGNPGERAGLRDLADVAPLAKAISEDSRLNLLGVSGFEGILHASDRTESGSKEVREFCRKVVAGAVLARPFVSHEKIILSAGGTSFFDMVLEEFAKYDGESLIVLRSGGYVSHDHGGYELFYPFQHESVDTKLIPAIEIWSQVISQPESHLSILNVGKRDLGTDVANPTPIKKRPVGAGNSVEPFAAEVNRLNDQHSYLFLKDPKDLGLTDLVGLGISHPCTTFDKWRYMLLVNDEYEVVDLLHTFF
ncbi:MAG: alanine racemase [Actinobacteria bacterium]|nr:alanine racemase [Actinomycetota bacterium]